MRNFRGFAFYFLHFLLSTIFTLCQISSIWHICFLAQDPLYGIHEACDRNNTSISLTYQTSLLICYGCVSAVAFVSMMQAFKNQRPFENVHVGLKYIAAIFWLSFYLIPHVKFQAYWWSDYRTRTTLIWTNISAVLMIFLALSVYLLPAHLLCEKKHRIPRIIENPRIRPLVDHEWFANLRNAGPFYQPFRNSDRLMVTFHAERV